jgi:hypothetical protein
MLKSFIDFMAGFDAAAQAPSTQTVTGKVVSLAYYAANQKRRGGGLDESLGAARATVRWKGNPAGIVTSDGKVYQIIGGLAANDNDKVSELLGQTVTITGEVSEQHGMMVISADSATPAG